MAKISITAFLASGFSREINNGANGIRNLRMRIAGRAVLCPAIAFLWGGIACAQSAPAPPPASVVDESGYDNVSRQVEAHVTDLTLGSGDFQLVHTQHSYGSTFNKYLLRDSFYGDLQPTGQTVYGALGGTVIAACNFQFSFGSYSDCFDLDGGSYAPRSQNGAKLVDNLNGTFTYISRDGVIFSIFGFAPVNSPGNPFGAPGVVTQVTYPTGLIMNIGWKFWSGSSGRIQSVTTNAGMQIKYSYLSNVTPTLADSSTLTNWTTKLSVKGINNRIEYCDPLADTCSLTTNWKTASYSWSGFIDNSGTQPHTMLQLSITGQDSVVTRYTLLGGITEFVSLESAIGGSIVAIKPPTSTLDIFTFTYCNPFNGSDLPYSPYCTFPLIGNYIDSTNNSGSTAPIRSGVAAYTKEGRAHRFILSAGSNGNGGGSTTFGQNLQVDPDGRQTIVGLINYVNPSRGSFPGGVSVHDGTSYNYAADTTGRIIRHSNGQDASFDYQYDDRGNVISMTRTPAAGSGITPLVTSASYPVTCTNMITCNKPTSITDPNGNVTQFSYDPVHGGVITTDGPLDANGVAPQSRNVYAQLTAQVRNAAGALVATSPIWVLVQESSCKTGPALGAGCANANDELRKTYQYGPTVGAQDLLLHGVVEDATGLALRTCYTYDLNGNRVSERKPKAKLASCP